jgi:hypothetical protein
MKTEVCWLLRMSKTRNPLEIALVSCPDHKFFGCLLVCWGLGGRGNHGTLRIGTLLAKLNSVLMSEFGPEQVVITNGVTSIPTGHVGSRKESHNIVSGWNGKFFILQQHQTFGHCVQSHRGNKKSQKEWYYKSMLVTMCSEPEVSCIPVFVDYLLHKEASGIQSIS